MKTSTLLDPYLSYCEDKPVTIGTYCTQQLHGKAKKYSGRYARALQNTINRLLSAGDVIPIKSVRGGTSYKRTTTSAE